MSPVCRSAALLAMLIASVARADPPQTDAEWLARGAATVLPFKQNLLEELSTALEQGPEHAIDVCRLRAPALAVEASSSAKQIGRTSERLRNPANAPKDWVKPILADYAARPSERAPRVVRIASGRVGYVEPIYVAPMCLTCHGESITPPLQARLRALYPQDRATGFRAGDLRGVFWVEFDESGIHEEGRR